MIRTRMQFWMAEAIREAAKGLGDTSPNPAVGAILVKANRIIARGHHRFFGGPHAEIEALGRIQNSRGIRGATLVVTLEPCNHFGKTPPCTEAILRSGIKRVVVGIQDPRRPDVAGMGIQKLRRAGVKVVLLNDPRVKDFYAPYRTYHAKKRCFVTLKLAVSLDGKMAADGVKWITGILARDEVQRIRQKVDAILVGRKTAVADNCRLTIRHGFQRNRRRPPTRIILSSTGSIPKHLRLLNDGLAPTWVIRQDQSSSLKKTVMGLAKRGIVHLLVEGGAKTARAFLRENLVDEILLFVSPRRLGPQALDAFSQDPAATQIRLEKPRWWQLSRTQKFGKDILLTFHPGA